MQCQSYTHEFCSRSSPRSLRWRSGGLAVGEVERRKRTSVRHLQDRVRRARRAGWRSPTTCPVSGPRGVLSTDQRQGRSRRQAQAPGDYRGWQERPAQRRGGKRTDQQERQFGISPCDTDIGIPAATKFQAASIPVVMACGSGWTFPRSSAATPSSTCGTLAALGAAQAEFAASRAGRGPTTCRRRRYFYARTSATRLRLVTSSSAAKSSGRATTSSPTPTSAPSRRRSWPRSPRSSPRRSCPRLHDIPQAAPRSRYTGGPGRRFLRHQRDAWGRKRPQQRMVHNPRLPDSPENCRLLRGGQETHWEGT